MLHLIHLHAQYARCAVRVQSTKTVKLGIATNTSVVSVTTTAFIVVSVHHTIGTLTGVGDS